MPPLPPAAPRLHHWQSLITLLNPGQSPVPASGKGASLLKVQSISGIGKSHEGPQYQAYTGVAFWVLLAAPHPSFVVA